MTVYSALLATYGSLEKQRARLAHGCFGICPDDEDLLFVIPVAKHVLWQADILPKHLKGVIPADSHEGLKESLWVYRMADFDRLHSEMEQMWWDFFYFNSYLRAPHESPRAAEFQKLLKSLQVQQNASQTASQTRC